jgi:hypothetical protein
MLLFIATPAAAAAAVALFLPHGAVKKIRSACQDDSRDDHVRNSHF